MDEKEHRENNDGHKVRRLEELVVSITMPGQPQYHEAENAAKNRPTVSALWT